MRDDPLVSLIYDEAKCYFLMPSKENAYFRFLKEDKLFVAFINQYWLYYMKHFILA